LGQGSLNTVGRVSLAPPRLSIGAAAVGIWGDVTQGLT
jgi:hypothetical protein